VKNPNQFNSDSLAPGARRLVLNIAAVESRTNENRAPERCAVSSNVLGVTCDARYFSFGVPGGREPEAPDDAGGADAGELLPADEDDPSLRDAAGEYPPPLPLELLLLGSILLRDDGEDD
jgi:hypothetical protein